jgi:hypothetical protein
MFNDQRLLGKAGVQKNPVSSYSVIHKVHHRIFTGISRCWPRPFWVPVFIHHKLVNKFPSDHDKKYETWRECFIYEIKFKKFLLYNFLFLKASCKECKRWVATSLRPHFASSQATLLMRDERWACDETSAPVQHVHIYLYECYGSVVVSMRIRCGSGSRDFMAKFL